MHSPFWILRSSPFPLLDPGLDPFPPFRSCHTSIPPPLPPFGFCGAPHSPFWISGRPPFPLLTWLQKCFPGDEKWAHKKPPTPEELGQNADGPKIEIYTDGTGGKTGQKGGGGYGWVEVTEGEETTNGFGPVIVNPQQPGHLGAEVSTNNTAEVSAVIHALRHARRTNKTHIVIRYDSEYAANMTQGKWRPKKGKNETLINTAKRTLELAEMTMIVLWKHVKGHSGDKWNDRADELADRGAELSESIATPAERVEEEDNDPVQQSLDTTPLLGLTKDRSEALRILRARTLHGTLNTCARGKELKSD